MDERSEAMVLRKTGGQNVVLLRMLKRTLLASASTCLNLGRISFYDLSKEKENVVYTDVISLEICQQDFTIF